MRVRVGLALAQDRVRAVAVRDRKIVWATEAPVEQHDISAATISALLAETPVRRWPAPVLSAAVGAHASQVKCVTGLPPIEDPATLAAIIREGAGSFFLKNGVPLITTGTRAVGAGAAFAAAIDGPCVVAIRDACRTRGWRLGLIAPAAVVLPLALEDRCFAWADGQVIVEITRTDGVLESIRTRPRCAADSGSLPSTPVPELARLGEEAVRYADAYGAALLDAEEPLALDPLAAGWWSEAELLKRFLMPGLVGIAALAVLLGSPLAAIRAAKRAEARVGRIRPDQWQAVSSALGELDGVTAILKAAHEFGATRSSVTGMLGDLARRLPEGSALTAFELSEGEGQLAIVTPRPAAVLTAIKGLAWVGSAELVGGLSQDPLSAHGLQRISVRFRTVARPSRATRPRGAP